jgi:hypothetical protein
MLTEEELLMIRGGGLAATMLNSLSRLIGTILELGRTVGSAIRRGYSKSYCKLD